MIKFSNQGPSVSKLVKNAAMAFLIAGCVSGGPKTSSPILDGSDEAGNPVYFSGTQAQIIETLENYSKTYDISTLEGQIDYLLFRLQTTPYRLERNGAGHTPQEGAQFFRWKMKRPKFEGRVNSVQDFVTVICSGSMASGEPYVATLADGSRHNMGAIFQNELDLLMEFRKPRTQSTEASLAAAPAS